jgi:AP-1 complex subunit beta-1
MDILIYISFCADIQVAIRNTQQGVFYFTDQIPLTALMVEDGRIEPAAFVQSWKNLPEANESQKELPISITSLDMVKSKIEAANIFLMAHKQVLPLAVLFAELRCQYLYCYGMGLLGM